MLLGTAVCKVCCPAHVARVLLRRRSGAQANISDKTIAVTAHHYDGTLEYNVHNLYGAYEVKATAEALRAIRNKRQFIFTRCGRRLARGWRVHDSNSSHRSPMDCVPLSICHVSGLALCNWLQ